MEKSASAAFTPISDEADPVACALVERVMVPVLASVTVATSFQLSTVSDRRCSLYTLSAETRTFILEAFVHLVDVLRSAERDDDAGLLARMDETKDRIGNHYGIVFTSFRYNILSSLFKMGQWHPSDGQKLAATSLASFYTVMEDLKSIGAIECLNSEHDRRKKLCQLTPSTHRMFSDAIRTITGHMVDHAEHRLSSVAPLALLFMDRTGLYFFSSCTKRNYWSFVQGRFFEGDRRTGHGLRPCDCIVVRDQTGFVRDAAGVEADEGVTDLDASVGVFIETVAGGRVWEREPDVHAVY